MCTNCESILGPNPRPHSEDKCPLKKASFCSICGPNTHFLANCPRKFATIPYKQEAIPSVKPVIGKRVYCMPNTNDSYMEYLRFHSILFESSIHNNRKAVEKHLTNRNYILENPPCLSKDACNCYMCINKNGKVTKT